ncbi:hypothetical protein [Halocatena marina]|uniref:Uncharacterized protein n=1 Tax=Halocatena marina TaxID=2934937 RepID=A0ABD5YM77_9EURY|nr:hypothetical protein [Halocatena marina]
MGERETGDSVTVTASHWMEYRSAEVLYISLEIMGHEHDGLEATEF